MKELVMVTTCDLCGMKSEREDEIPTLTFNGIGIVDLVFEVDVCLECREDKLPNLKMSKLQELSREVTSLHKNTGKKSKSPKVPCPDCGKMVSARGMTMHRKSHD